MISRFIPERIGARPVLAVVEEYVPEAVAVLITKPDVAGRLRDDPAVDGQPVPTAGESVVHVVIAELFKQPADHGFLGDECMSSRSSRAPSMRQSISSCGIEPSKTASQATCSAMVISECSLPSVACFRIQR